MLATPEEWEIIRLSLKVGAVAVGGTMPIAFGLAWLLAYSPGSLTSISTAFSRLISITASLAETRPLPPEREIDVGVLNV